MNPVCAIHQFTPTLALGDSVSNGLLFIQKMLHDMGYESKIYICDTQLDKNLRHEIFHISQYLPSQKNLLLYHHSIGHTCHKLIMQLQDKKVLIYHNITPAHFFTHEKHLQAACDEGRSQLKDAAKYVIAALADSAYNAKELEYFHYKNIKALPLLELDLKVSTPSNKIVNTHASTYNILFVGRVVQNKCQHQLIDVMLQLRKRGVREYKLFIVGGVSQPSYFEYLKQYAQDLELSQQVLITNKVSDEDLAAYYKAADLYLSLSEHEGFGIPLIEAMKYDIPVLAYNAGGISTTLPKEALLEKKAASYVSEEIITLQNDPFFRVQRIKKQKEHLKNFSYNSLKNRFIDFLHSLDIATPSKLKPKLANNKIKVQIEGPFDSSYSLSIVNRTLALALNNDPDFEVKLHSTEGYGDFEPQLDKLDPLTKELATKTLDSIDITLRNLYPPRTNAMKGYHKIIGPYGWEESRFPQPNVSQFNARLTLIFAMSDYVKNLLKDNGVAVPIVTTGLVVEEILHVKPEPTRYPLPSGFRLLHVSSAFPRKGIAILLDAFESLQDDLNISLIIKTFPNPHNTTVQQLEDRNFHVKRDDENNVTLYEKNAKQILLINTEITASTLKYLYSNSQALIAPSFGEGFGLPMAEAMLLDLPVITTAYGGQSDFCTPQTAWLIDFRFEYAKTHMHLDDSIWVRPDVKSLQEQITLLYHATPEQLSTKTIAARSMIKQRYSAKQIAQTISQSLQKLPTCKPKKQLALFSSYHTKCGIASYAKELISSFEDEVMIYANKTQENLTCKDIKNVSRCWEEGRDVTQIDALKEALLKDQITHLIIQYNFSFIPLARLAELLLFCDDHKIETHLFLHATQDVYAPSYTDSFSSITLALKKATKIYLHTLKDMNTLKGFGLSKNLYHFIHGIKSASSLPCVKNTLPTLASFGFLLPQKGILELVDTAQVLHERGIKVNLLLLTSLHHAPVSQHLLSKLQEKIQHSPIKEYITLITDYLSEDEILAHLSQADKILFLYTNTQESSSAAVRMGLRSLKEVITTPLSIFDDVKPVVTQTADHSSQSIVDTIASSLQKPFEHTKQKEWIQARQWKNISTNFYKAL